MRRHVTYKTKALRMALELNDIVKYQMPEPRAGGGSVNSYLEDMRAGESLQEVAKARRFGTAMASASGRHHG